ncbi:MAG: hypothetical protein KBC84_03405 [Proteobacteria bacterium]|nr:hypothetical protein [Pseudomonadota bacterium]
MKNCKGGTFLNILFFFALFSFIAYSIYPDKRDLRRKLDEARYRLKSNVNNLIESSSETANKAKKSLAEEESSLIKETSRVIYEPKKLNKTKSLDKITHDDKKELEDLLKD